MQSIPIFLITGFLGSGKTTFINWILSTYHDHHISVILNEFGNIKLESQFVKQQAGEVVELANGCMCCVAKSDIPRVIAFIQKNSPQTEYILIEASGLSDPDPIKEVLSSKPLSDQVHLHSTYCIIDISTFLDTYKDHPLVLSQAADADSIIFSKLTTSSPETIEETKKVIHTNLSATPTHDWDASFHLDIFETQTEMRPKSESDTDHHLHEAFDQYWFATTAPVDPEKFKTVFLQLGPSIFRAKGRITDSKDTYLVQYASGTLTVEKTQSTAEQPPTAVLLLGEKLDVQALKTKFDTLL